MKTLIAMLLFGAMCAQAIAQTPLWWGAKLGLSDIISDLETRDRIVKLPGKESNAFTLGVSVSYPFENGSKYTAQYLFRTQKNDDIGSLNYRGRSIRTYMNTVSILAQYDLLRYFFDLNLPVVLYGGGGIDFYFSTHRFTIDPYFGGHPSDLYRKTGTGFIFLLNTELIYPINEYMEAGFYTSYGMGSNDYLEGYSTTNSSYNDDIVSYCLTFYYRFNPA